MSGTIVAIAHRPTDGEPMVEIREGTLVPGRGLDTENRKSGKREVTFLSKQAWAETCRELDAELPWHARRANVLIDGIDLAVALGKTLCIGDARIRLHGETRPCHIMDEQHDGLRRALEPDCRGGVFGQVLAGGVIRAGDRVEVM
jgi:MOSC domain-containing protein YiiM